MAGGWLYTGALLRKAPELMFSLLAFVGKLIAAHGANIWNWSELVALLTNAKR
jgi:hypothetical protein